ncbi:tRNA-guanine transglycosylase [Tuber magnatum]|uniref:Queuine tRNA-ribosyltransferase accessory subunit 2 n=1 Tax=Tuber magnatum TaxID=42249 RepID=A0A317SH91_9PEZI|nr:tRNA-guanine transglycosylase [Tuber magnatum]
MAVAAGSGIVFDLQTARTEGIPGSGNNGRARVGRFAAAGSGVSFDTPSFIAQTSRGAVPHLSGDNLRDHTDVRVVCVALEDFVEKCHPNVPVYNHPSTLRNFISHPSNSLLVLAPRRSPPVTTATSNTDASIAILTSVGFRILKVDDYFNAVSNLRPDIAISPPDLPHQKPGKTRRPKMVSRTELWLGELIKRNTPNTPIFAPILPLDIEQQQSYYLDYLKEHISSLSGLALYDARLAIDMPDDLKGLPRLSLDEALTPHKVLQQVSWGVDVLNPAFLTRMTDSGISLKFQFPGETAGEKEALGVDLWNKEYGASLEPLAMGCKCYACRKHHRAYVQHLLVAKEMTAWVLLQIHNAKMVSNFFAAIRESITRGTFEEDCKTFAEAYAEEFPEKTGHGPRCHSPSLNPQKALLTGNRLRGYQFKSEGGVKKKNPKAFNKLGGDRRETLEELETPPDIDTKVLERGRFVEISSG